MRWTYEEAMKQMEALVEKMQHSFPEDSYKIQCVWETVLEHIQEIEEVPEDRYQEGWDDGYHKGYDRGYEHGYEDKEPEE